MGRAKKDTYHWCEYDCVGFGALPFPFPDVFDTIFEKKKRSFETSDAPFRLCFNLCGKTFPHRRGVRVE